MTKTSLSTLKKGDIIIIKKWDLEKWIAEYVSYNMQMIIVNYIASSSSENSGGSKFNPGSSRNNYSDQMCILEKYIYENEIFTFNKEDLDWLFTTSFDQTLNVTKQ